MEGIFIAPGFESSAIVPDEASMTGLVLPALLPPSRPTDPKDFEGDTLWHRVRQEAAGRVSIEEYTGEIEGVTSGPFSVSYFSFNEEGDIGKLSIGTEDMRDGFSSLDPENEFYIGPSAEGGAPLYIRFMGERIMEFAYGEPEPPE